MKLLTILLGIVAFSLLISCSSHRVDLANSEKITKNDSKTAIIFVHGFMGDHENTWTNNETRAYWPKIMATDPVLKNFDIFSINYFTELFGNRFTLKELGIWFNVELKNIGVIGRSKYENIIFVAHSMGNLVVRAGIYEENSKYDEVKIPLILSLGAPSKGSDLGTIGKVFFPNNQSFSNLSSSNNHYVNLLNEQWRKSKGDTKIACAYEKIGYGNFGLIVSENSATAVCTGTAWPVVSDHISMVKPKDSNDRIFIWAKNEIIENLNSPTIRNKINFRNLYSSDGNRILPKKTKAIQNDKISYKENINEIKKSIASMYSSDVDEFLIKIIPKIQNGITCDDLVQMIVLGYSSDAAEVVKKVAPYIRKPFSSNCLKKIGAVTYSSESAGAISALLTSEFAY